MASQPKRRRPNDDAQESSSNPTVLDVSQLKPHETVWFNDGNIMLATDVHLYRVHKGVLAKSSSVFRDMLDFASGSDEGGEKDTPTGGDRWNGVPLVRMFDDNDESLYHLLMTLYDRDYYRGNKPAPFSTIVSLLRLSTKYDVSSIRREVVEQLSQFFPSTLEGWIRKDKPFPFCDFPPGCTFRLLAAARQCDIRVLLPCMFYRCANETLEDIFKYSGLLQSEDFRRLVTGRDKLLRYAYEFGARALFVHERCASEECSKARASLLMIWMDFEEFDDPVNSLNTLKDGLSEIGGDPEDVGGHSEDVCGVCNKKSAAAVKEVRKKIWDSLPATFELDGWEKVKGAGV